MKNGKFFALLVFSSIIFFALFLVWTFNHRGSLDSFSVESLAICLNVDDDFCPRSVGDRFRFGTRQLCLWLKHNGGRAGDSMRFMWYFRGQLIYQERYVLSKPQGRNLFYLLRDDGSPLPVGDYRVDIRLNSHSVKSENFVISNE